MAINGATGTKIYIGPTTAATDASSYAALTYVEIKEVESIGEFGDTSSTVNFTSLSDARVRKLKGARDAGDVTVTCGHDPLDAGQIAAIAAEKTNFAYAIKVVPPDAADANDPDSIFYFHAKVMSAKFNAGDSGSVQKRTFVLGIDSAIVEDPSTAVS